MLGRADGNLRSSIAGDFRIPEISDNALMLLFCPTGQPIFAGVACLRR